MGTYTIKAVNPETRQYDTKFGPMVSYKVLFNEIAQAVEISQKTTTPAPAVGDTLEGTIDMSGQYGPKFKKEYSQGGFTTSGGNTPSGASKSFGGGKPQDTFTMYLSYAKDIAVALIAAGERKGANYTDLVEEVLTGGYELYNARPGAEDKPAVEAKPAQVDMSALDKIFEVPEGQVTIEDDPWTKS